MIANSGGYPGTTTSSQLGIEMLRPVARMVEATAGGLRVRSTSHGVRIDASNRPDVFKEGGGRLGPVSAHATPPPPVPPLDCRWLLKVRPLQPDPAPVRYHVVGYVSAAHGDQRPNR